MHPSRNIMEITLRAAKETDAEFTYEWRNHPKTRQYSNNTDVIIKNNHIEWFKKAILSPERFLLIAESNDPNRHPLGVLRYDFSNEDALVSIYINPELHNKGIGTKILLAGSEYIQQKRSQTKTLTAQILKENKASIRAFQKAGYQFSIDDKYTLKLPNK